MSGAVRRKLFSPTSLRALSLSSRGTRATSERQIESAGVTKALALGLVDAVVMTIAERLRPDAIATLDLRHFAAVPIRGNPRLFPRDLPEA
jgi:predicted nucleic acid-binding protein